jgi:hypothetical protein
MDPHFADEGSFIIIPKLPLCEAERAGERRGYKEPSVYRRLPNIVLESVIQPQPQSDTVGSPSLAQVIDDDIDQAYFPAYLKMLIDIK